LEIQPGMLSLQKIFTMKIMTLMILYFVLRRIDREHKLKCNRTLINDFRTENPEKTEAIGRAIKDINSTPEIKIIDFLRTR
jgi:hypothetical protein